MQSQQSRYAVYCCKKIGKNKKKNHFIVIRSVVIALNNIIVIGRSCYNITPGIVVFNVFLSYARLVK